MRLANVKWASVCGVLALLVAASIVFGAEQKAHAQVSGDEISHNVFCILDSFGSPVNLFNTECQDQGGQITQCSDSIDNDGDGLIDSDDPACHTDGDASNAATYDGSLDSELPVNTDLCPNIPGLQLSLLPGFEIVDGDCVPVQSGGGDGGAGSGGSSSDLSLTKTVDNDAPAQGGQVVYTLTVHNAGPDSAAGVAVSEMLPNGLTYVSDDGAGAYATSSGVWTVGTVSTATDHVLHITAMVGSTTEAIVNTASIVSDDSSDSNTDNDTSSVSLTAKTQCADGIDNDGDGAIDSADPGCHTDFNADNSDSYDATLNDESATQAPLDVCPNIDGDQASVPEGKVLDDSGNCVDAQNGGGGTPPATDLCSNLAGMQATVPEGKVAQGNGTCIDASNPNEPQSGGGGGGGGGGGNGPIIANLLVPQGQVLGASTSTVGAMCSTPLLTAYLRIGRHNDADEVKKLQQFLNGEMSAGLPVTGYFGPMTDAAVRSFQLKFATDVLSPWLPYGLESAQSATGYVYKTTQRKINLLYCASLQIPMPTLP